LNAENHYVGVQYFEPLQQEHNAFNILNPTGGIYGIQYFECQQQEHNAFNILKSTPAPKPGIELPRLSSRGALE